MDLYKKSTKSNNQTYFENIARVSHRITVQRALNDSTGNSLKTQNQNLLQQKEANKATLLDIQRSNSVNAHRPLPLSSLKNNNSAKSLPSSPLLTTASSNHNNNNNTNNNNNNNNNNSNNTNSSASNKHKTLQISSSKPLSSLSLQSGVLRVLHLLALGPNSIQGLASRTNKRPTEIDQILKEHAKPVDSNNKNNNNNNNNNNIVNNGKDQLYALADNKYKDLRIWDWKHYTPAERKQVIKDSQDAFDRLKYPADHSARRNLIDPKLREKITASKKPKSKEFVSSSDDDEIQEVTSKNTDAGASLKRKAASSIINGTTTKKGKLDSPNPLLQQPATNSHSKANSMSSSPRSSHINEDLFALARKFKDQYSEYAKLYNLLNIRNKKNNTNSSKAEYQKLLSMHKELESWKQKLWASTNTSTAIKR